MWKIIIAAIAAFFVLTAESCDNAPSATQKEAAAQERIQAEQSQQQLQPQPQPQEPQRQESQHEGQQ